jgi:hypothetical protein
MSKYLLEEHCREDGELTQIPNLRAKFMLLVTVGQVKRLIKFAPFCKAWATPKNAADLKGAN